MKVSLNLAQQFSNVDLKSIPRDELLKRIGEQLGAVEDVTDWEPKFEGAVIVRVVSCVKHENADKLNVCRIDDGGKNQAVERGEDGLIQVVCGAPNVHSDMYAVWLAPGVTVPSTRNTDPFVLEARDIRGVVSNGMLASASELGISDDHSGIVVVDGQEVGHEPLPGEPLTNYFGLDDFVIDCENKMFTHRPDCFGNLGVARELAGISGLHFDSPDWYSNAPQFTDADGLSLFVQNDVQELVPRFLAVAMKQVTIKPSPMWLQALLTRVGIKPINNVVDVTNYVMHLTGQPLHAFDYDKVKVRSDRTGIFPRKSRQGEKLTLLGQKEIELTGEELVISTDKQAVALAGVMGGAETEVDENTKNIIIEAATFDMYSIRRTSMRHGLFTDAVTRFNKGQSHLQNDRALAFAMEQMSKLAGAQQASKVWDIKTVVSEPAPVHTDTAFINERLGIELSVEQIQELLHNVEFDVSTDENHQLLIRPPFWRTDIELPEDVVEEIGRLYGYDKLPVALPPQSAKPTPKNALLERKMQLRTLLKERGANEVLTYSFVHGDLLYKTGTDPEKWAYHIRNAISPDLQYYRTSLMPSLLAKIHPNIKTQAGSSDNHFALFEIGKAHVKGHEDEQKLPKAMHRLALVITADDKTARSQHAGAAYYSARKYLDALTNGGATLKPLTTNDYPITGPYDTARSAMIEMGGEVLGVIGEFRSDVRHNLKLPTFSAGLELDIELLHAHLKPSAYQPLPAFPGTDQDITFEMSADTAYADVYTVLNELLVTNAETHGYVMNLEPRDIYSPEGTDTKRLSFRVHLSHPSKTLKTEEVNTFIDDVAAAACTRLNATRI